MTALIAASPLVAQDTNTILDVTGPGGKNITAYDRKSDRSFGGYFDTEYFTSDSAADFRAHRLVLQSSARLMIVFYLMLKLNMNMVHKSLAMVKLKLSKHGLIINFLMPLFNVQVLLLFLLVV